MLASLPCSRSACNIFYFEVSSSCWQPGLTPCLLFKQLNANTKLTASSDCFTHFIASAGEMRTNERGAGGLHAAGGLQQMRLWFFCLIPVLASKPRLITGLTYSLQRNSATVSPPESRGERERGSVQFCSDICTFVPGMWGLWWVFPSAGTAARSCGRPARRHPYAGSTHCSLSENDSGGRNLTQNFLLMGLRLLFRTQSSRRGILGCRRLGVCAGCCWGHAGIPLFPAFC